MLNVSHKSKFKRYFVYPITGALANMVYFGIRMLPFKFVSGVGGFIGRLLGPLFKEHKIARTNLKNAFPLKSDKEIDDILIGMWDNLGRTCFEFPCMDYLEKHPEMVNILDYEEKTDHTKPRIYFSAHMANWETLSFIGHKISRKLGFVFRPFNNPYMNNLMNLRANHYEQEAIEKGPIGVRKLAKHLKSGDDIVILMDQRLDEGVKIKFFNQDAMAVPSVARLAERYGADIFSIFMTRKDKTNFEVKIEKLDLSEAKDVPAEEKALWVTQKTHDLLEAEIKKHPEQWFWVHNRWKIRRK